MTFPTAANALAGFSRPPGFVRQSCCHAARSLEGTPE